MHQDSCALLRCHSPYRSPVILHRVVEGERTYYPLERISKVGAAIPSPETSTFAGSEAVSGSGSSTYASPICSPRPARSAPIEWKTPSEAGLDVRAELGRGNYGTVHLAWKAPLGTFRCVKRFRRRGMSNSAFDAMVQEYQALRLVESHPCVGKAFGLCQDSDFFHIEMELYEGGDFTKLASHAADARVLTTEAWWGKVFKQCLEGLRHVHSKGIIHCDIKEPNLMIRNRKYHNPSVVIVDFGVAQAEGVSRPTPYGTPGYIPPEVWRTHEWHTQGDLFSLGVVILQMLIGRTPTDDYPGRGVFVNNRSLEEVAKVTTTREPPISSMPSSYHNLKSLVTQLLQKDARYRPSAHEALSGNWMDQLNKSVESLSNDTLSTSADEAAKAQILDNDTSKIASAGVGSSTAPDNHHVDSSDSWVPAIAASSVLPFLLLALL